MGVDARSRRRLRPMAREESEGFVTAAAGPCVPSCPGPSHRPRESASGRASESCSKRRPPPSVASTRSPSCCPNPTSSSTAAFARKRCWPPRSKASGPRWRTQLSASGRAKVVTPGEFRRSQNWIGGSRPGTTAFVPPPPRCSGGFIHGLLSAIGAPTTGFSTTSGTRVIGKPGCGSSWGVCATLRKRLSPRQGSPAIRSRTTVPESPASDERVRYMAPSPF